MHYNKLSIYSEKGVFMKEIFKNGASLFLKTIVINIMCFFIVISFNVLATAAFTKNIGYTAYGTSSTQSEQTELYTYYYDDGDDTQKAEYEEEGYTVSTSPIRSEISSAGTAVFLTVSQIFCILILIAFIYPNIWHLGTNDSNLVRFKHKPEDKFKGVKIGAIAVIPSYLFLIFIVIAKFGAMPKFPMVLYKFLNASFYSLIDVVLSGTVTVGELSVWRLVILFIFPLTVPAVAGVAYLLGYKNFSIGEKLVYKKK